MYDRSDFHKYFYLFAHPFESLIFVLEQFIREMNSKEEKNPTDSENGIDLR